MKNKIRFIRSYLPWLFVLFSFDLFILVILWIANIKMLQALFLLLLFTSIIMFSIITFIIIVRESKKEKAYKTFFADPSKKTESELIRLVNVSEKEIIKTMAAYFYKLQAENELANSLLTEYENYVEMWAHEIKVPLSLLALVLDNQNTKLPKDVAFKLDYARNQIYENVSQILFYHQVKRTKKDFLFEQVDLCETLSEVLKDYKPLLYEKHFEINLDNIQGTIYTDYRSFEFIISQIIANAVKYSSNRPILNISMRTEDGRKIIVFKDNGCGVKSCDLPHVFEKGFTGDCGTARKKSTGMGLYLVKQLADNLRIDIQVKSEWMQGFEISLSCCEAR